MEDDGTASVRFGDDQNGRRPESGMTFTARYRIGNGSAGNVGAEAIAHAVTSNGAVMGVRNPMPASGGVDPEETDEARRRAPYMFRQQQERAVTTYDYATMTGRAPGVQRAAARRRWTGSWLTMFIAVDRTSGALLTDTVERDLRQYIDRYRMAGHDVEFDNPRFVPLELVLHVCVNPRAYTGHVRVSLARALGALFAPDRLTFGQTVYLSPIYSAVHAVEGVDSAQIVTFQRRGLPDRRPLQEGRMEFGRLEIPQLDNDPSAPDRGVLTLVLKGGKR
jgi:predicted phage baseplate assembly protein